MTKYVLFIQGAGEGAHDADGKLATSLRHLLGSSYEVRYPVMQNEDDADYETWAQQIKEELSTVNGAVILVGHSVGASVLIKFLTEKEIEKTVAGVFLIAAPYWGDDKGWTYEGYETLALTKNLKHPIEVPVSFYHSNDDEVVPFKHLALYANKFPTATLREINGRGHQLNNDLSEVASDIKKLV